jgi:RNA polymerase sigma-70 factor (ECF subfamily)
MKVPAASPHDPDVTAAAAQAQATGAELDFTHIYEEWFAEVARWARALGGPEADLDDLAQEVFLVVRRKLHTFDGRNLAGWLYRITAHTVSDYRRRAWFRRLFRRPRDVRLDEVAAPDRSPAEQIERRQARRLLYEMLDRMSEKHRSAFILFEIEGRSGEEIAALQGIPVATVWTRLHYARKEFLAMVEKLRRTEMSP